MPISVQKKIYPSVGRCIYCGDDHGALGDEHIIPFGIGGRLTLPKASCRKCERLTSGRESQFQNIVLGDARVQLRFPTKHGPMKGRGNVRLLLEEEPGKLRAAKIPASRAPLILSLPVMDPPEELFGRPWQKKPIHWIAYDPSATRKFIDDFGIRGFVKSHQFDIVHFSLMLAKIAHAFAVAELPAHLLATFSLPLPELISKDTTTIPKRFVGGVITDKVFPPSGVLNQITLFTMGRRPKEYLVAIIRLLSPWATPPYWVVVGKRAYMSGNPLPLATPYILLEDPQAP